MAISHRERRQAYAEYNRLTGQLVHTSSHVEWDLKRKALVKYTTEYIDLGRPDPIQPLTGEEQLALERFEGGLADTREQKQAAIREATTNHVRTYGPANIMSIAKSTGIDPHHIGKHIRSQEGELYVQVGTWGKAILWGLVGVHDQESDVNYR